MTPRAATCYQTRDQAIMKAAIYARYSSDRQSETNIEAQERLCRARTDALGLTVAAVYAAT